MADNPLYVTCIVDGQTIQRSFGVKIPPTSTVHDLKKAIKVQLPNSCYGISADALTLWRVSIPAVPGSLNHPIVLKDLIDELQEPPTKLDPRNVIADVLPKELTDTMIYILVQKPPPVQVIRFIVEGASRQFGSTVRIQGTDTVDDVKNTIKTQMDFILRGIDVHSLNLWRVSIPVKGGKRHGPVLLSVLAGLSEPPVMLTQTDKIVDVLPKKMSGDIIYIVVQLPPPVHAPILARDDASVFCRPVDKSSFFTPLTGNLDMDIKTVTDKFFAPGSAVDKFLGRFVQGLENLPLTTGSVPGLPRVCLRNNDRLSNTHPNLLFSGLPDTSSGDGTQSRQFPTSDAILQQIEDCSLSIDSTAPIFGVSGCGKTRGLIELLSRRWGFYFNASGNDLGSDDLTALISHVRMRLGQDQRENDQQARMIVYLLLLSRLKVLQHCLSFPDSGKTFTSARWTILQTCPHVLGNDVFGQLFRRFLPFLTPTLEESCLLKVTQDELQVTECLMFEHGVSGAGLRPAFTKSDKLLVVFDEAQILGEMGIGRFLTMDPDQEPGKSLLSPILSGVQKVSLGNFRLGLNVITSGSKLSIHTSKGLLASGAAVKYDLPPRQRLDGFIYLELPSWTGRESIERYVAGLRDVLQTEEAKRQLDRLLPPEAIQAMSEKLGQGQMGPLVRAIEKTVAFDDPENEGWRRAIDETEARLVSLDHQRYPENLCSAIVGMENKCCQNPLIAKELGTAEEALGLFLFQRYMFGADKLVFQEAVPELVERGFGHIEITDREDVRTVLDAPFVLKAAENYFRMRDSGFFKTLEECVQLSNKMEGHRYAAWELMMMKALTEAFNTHRNLSKWPLEPPISSQSAILNGNAVIVGLNEQEGLQQRGVSHEHISMEDFMNAHVHQNSMHHDRPVPPFFFPKPAPSGPDMVFFIRINGNLFPVFVQLKLRQMTTTSDTTNTVIKSASFAAPTVGDSYKEGDLGKYCPTGKMCISIVIAYPAEVVAKLCPRPDPEFAKDGLKEIAVKINERNFEKIFPQSHVDFLGGIQGPVKRLAADALEAEMLNKRKM